MSQLRSAKKDLFSSIGRDKKLNDEIVQVAASKYEELGERATATGPLESVAPVLATDRAVEVLDGQSTGDMAMEAIIRLTGRPVIRIRDDALVTIDIPTTTLKDELDPHLAAITGFVKSVGRIELDGHRRLPWAGTGWVVEEDIIVTNRHVAREFGQLSGSSFSFLPGIFGGPIEVAVDFIREHGNSNRATFEIVDILHIEPSGGPDIAFLKVDWTSGDGSSRGRLNLWDGPFDDSRRIAVVGYPARDTRTDIPAKMDDIFDGIYNIKRFAPGFVIGMSQSQGLLTHDCTTLGGNSGSAVVDIASGKVVALHFAGREQDANFAVLAPVIKARLAETKAGTAITVAPIAESNVVVEEKPTLADMADRDGYDPDFLGVSIPLPQLSVENAAKVATVADRDDGELKYTHYSVVMNSERRVAFYSVANIDGNQLHGIPRGSDKWYFDPRISLDHQVGNDLYKSNPLDRGHLVRRLDPAWGASRDVAELGVEDSFFYTNCAPQHLKLNRRTWLGLEDHILNNAGAFDLKVTVFTGPVFRDDDEEHRNVKIPNEFWKIVAIVVPGSNGDSRLSATGYALSQRSLIEDLEFVFGDHQGFQVRIDLIEELAGLDFGSLRDADPLARLSEEESATIAMAPRGRRLRTFADIVL
jgi:endonuclease G